MTTPVNDRYGYVAGMSLPAEDQYQREVAWTEPLTDEEEQRLLQHIVRSRREPSNQRYALLAARARDRLVEGYQTLVISIARRYARRLHHTGFLDLVQEGNLGLLEALERYDEGFHTPLKRLAAFCIRTTIIDALYDHDSMVRLSPMVRAQLSVLRQTKRELENELGREPSSAEIAGRMGVDEVEVLDLALFEVRRRVGSLQGLLEDADADEQCNFVSLFQVEVAAEDERALLRQEQVRAALDNLSPRQREIVHLRYGFEGGLAPRKTHVFEGGVQLCATQAVADTLGISRGAASSTLCQVHKRLRQTLAPLCDDRQAVSA